MNGAAAGRCSQLSTTSSRCLAARKRSTASSADSPASGTIASALTIAAGDIPGRVDRRERHEPRAVREVGLDGARGLERQPRLADAARPGQRQQPDPPAAQPLGDRADLAPRDRPSGSAAPAARSRTPATRRARPARSASSAGSWRRMRLVHARAARRPARSRPPRRARGGRPGRPPAPRPGGRCDTARASAAPCSRSRVGCSPRSCWSSRTSAACRPAARSASTRASNAAEPLLLQARDLRRRERLELRTPPAAARATAPAPRAARGRALGVARRQRAPAVRHRALEALGVELARAARSR